MNSCCPGGAVRSFPNFDKSTSAQVFKHGCSLLFAQPGRLCKGEKYSNTSARVSFAFAQSRLIESCHPVVKAAFMVAKSLLKHEMYGTIPFFVRDRCAPSSHVLKCAVLASVANAIDLPKRAKNDNYLKIDFQELIKWIRRILGTLFGYVAEDRVPTMFIPSFKLNVWKFKQFVGIVRDQCDILYIKLYSPLGQHRQKTIIKYNKINVLMI